MKKTFLTLAAGLVLTLNAQAGLNIKDSKTAGLLYGFLSVSADPQNAGDGVLLVTADVSCSEHEAAANALIETQYYCMSEVGNLTGDIAKTVYMSLPAKSSESFENNITLRQGSVSCSSIELANAAPKYNCR